MEPLNQDIIIARQRERILARIEKANQVVDSYENILLSSGDPREKLRAKEGIAETEQLILKYKSQLMALEQDHGLPTNHTIAQNAAAGQERASNDIELEENKPGDSSEKAPYNVQDLDRKLEELQRGVDDLKHGQSAMYQLLTETRNHELQMIIALFHQRGIEQEDMKQMLEVVQNTVSILQTNQNNLSAKMQRAVADASSALNSEASLQGKLELTLPIIPLLLDYKVELAATNSVDLNRFWENTLFWWTSLLKRASKNIWSLSILIEYGNYVHAENSIDSIDPVQAAQNSLRQYHEEFDKRDSYISEFEVKINHSTSNLNILIRAPEEFNALENLSEKFLQELILLSQKPDYPKRDLERIKELAGNIAAQAQSAAGSVANNGNATPQINQIKQNLSMLRRIVKQLLSWLEQMSTI